ncbi:membrane protein insertion efficiency factor YidD [Nostoc sp. ChiQUE01b]|uniref:membrane protein insertion efficiency factor YidD n=1 Tax=Nostoc sp. ChiQUE01b TaxID=3075376 RepID=UPI002AD3DD40|nr:membrane protein insertion efficiency factor YidD [Nostoc sp. ChiQUE01b]MDZ8261915.1 membrane protein insertion efficiency factor YidD [Nostoc sp. ChiQUE01b]
MQSSLFDSFTRQVSTAAITGYQKHISLHKGFACAHRILYGGESCSQYIKQLVAKKGLKAAFVNSRERFQACKQANEILRMHSENSEESTEEEADTQQSQQASRKVAQKSSFISSNNTDCFDCADLGCNCAEMVSMTPDCSSLDCSSADCSFIDCGSCGS